MATAKQCPNTSLICLLERRPLRAGNSRGLSLCLACNTAACRTLGLILCFRPIPECGEVCGVAWDIWLPLRTFTVKLHLAEQGSKCHYQPHTASALDKELADSFGLGGNSRHSQSECGACRWPLPTRPFGVVRGDEALLLFTKGCCPRFWPTPLVPSTESPWAKVKVAAIKIFGVAWMKFQKVLRANTLLRSMRRKALKPLRTHTLLQVAPSLVCSELCDSFD